MDFIYNGKAASHFDLHISSDDTYGTAERVINEHQIPGKIPQIYLEDTHKLTPYQRTFEAALVRCKDLPQQTAAIKQWLMADGQYHKLEDTYQPDGYRMAIYNGGLPTSWMGANRRSLTFPIVFNCQPQFWLHSGERYHTISQTTGELNLINPTGLKTYPVVQMGFYSTDPDTDAFGFAIWSETGPAGYCIAIDRVYEDYIRGHTFWIDCATEEIWDENGRNSNHLFDIGGHLMISDWGAFMMMISAHSGSMVGSLTKDALMQVQPRWWRW